MKLKNLISGILDAGASISLGAVFTIFSINPFSKHSLENILMFLFILIIFADKCVNGKKY